MGTPLLMVRGKRPFSPSLQCSQSGLSQTGVMPISGRAQLCDFDCAACKPV
jgi:hypothetical protein